MTVHVSNKPTEKPSSKQRASKQAITANKQQRNTKNTGVDYDAAKLRSLELSAWFEMATVGDAKRFSFSRCTKDYDRRPSHY
jgi:hypothetical protein